MEAKYDKASDAIKNNVTSRKGTWDLIGDLFELYIPQIFSTLIGGNATLANPGLTQSEEADSE